MHVSILKKFFVVNISSLMNVSVRKFSLKQVALLCFSFILAVSIVLDW